MDALREALMAQLRETSSIVIDRTALTADDLRQRLPGYLRNRTDHGRTNTPCPAVSG